MLNLSCREIQSILNRYHIFADIISIEELLRYDCDVTEQDKKEIKLILKIVFPAHHPVVIKFRGGNAERNRQFVIEAQTEFADILRNNGIPTPLYYKSGNSFSVTYEIQGYFTVVTVEDFCENEITLVDDKIAHKTGELLALAHNISETNDCHIPNKVIFDPFEDNDLFDFRAFSKIKDKLSDKDKNVYDKICASYHARVKKLEAIKGRRKYAVQGDLSDCNTFMADNSTVGMFDFNCSGDAVLFCDAIMQGWFVAHLMDYKHAITNEYSDSLATNFFDGYSKHRPFSEIERKLIGDLYAIISAFDCRVMEYNEDSLRNAVERNDMKLVSEILLKTLGVIEQGFTYK